MSLLSHHPLPALLQRLKTELSAAFSDGPVRIGRSPIALDVMGGIAIETGSISATTPLERLAATTAVQSRDDALLQVFSFNELDAHRPFTLCMPMRTLQEMSIDSLRQALSEPGRRWAWSVIGAVRELCIASHLNMQHGLNVALLDTIPLQRSSSADASIAAACVMALVDSPVSAATLAKLVRGVQLSMLGHNGSPGEALPAISPMGAVIEKWQSGIDPMLSPIPIPIPIGMRLVAIDINTQRTDGDRSVERTRVAAAMAHTLILKKMREMGTAAGRTLVADPMNGLLGRLDSNDYKRWFRPYLPEQLRGSDFSGDLPVMQDVDYPVRGAADHHVLESLRVRNFCRFLQQANTMQPDDLNRGIVLDKAGHLMYASHQSFSGDAGLGVEQADQVVRLVRQRERFGLYGARLTGDGSSGIVAVLCEDNDRATTGLADVLMAYTEQTALPATTYRTASEPVAVAGGETTTI